MAFSIRPQIKGVLKKADIEINGNRAWDLQVHNEKLFKRVVRQGSVGLGEAYMDGWWDAKRLDEFFCKVLKAELDRSFTNSWRKIWSNVRAMFSNPQNREKAYEVGEHHYDVGNDLYRVMLDDRMVYTCGFWRGGWTR